MANILNGLFGGAKPSASPVPSGDSDFADFAGAPDPSPTPGAFTAAPGGASLGGAPAATGLPYSKWYNIHERHSLGEFKLEGGILAVSAVIFLLHIIGSRLNRRKAKAWATAHAPILRNEFASVGFSPRSTVDTDHKDPEGVLREKSLFEFASYGTGRQNVAFMDVKLTLTKRFNPVLSIVETVSGFFMDSVEAPHDSLEAVIYPFDGKESLTVPSVPGTHELRSKENKSTYDNFVWALVSKERMKQVREDRYDVSITFTKDHNKLPNWITVMSESAEITEQLLTPELIKAVEAAGDAFDYLIVSDQPMEKPATIEETVPRKRIFLRYRLPSNNNYESLAPLFEYFVRIPDALVSGAHFRPEVLRKVRSVRDETIAQIKKAADAEKAEERALEREKQKKAKRDAELSQLDAKAQKKYLEREREREQKKSMKKQTMRG
ncbi:UPF0674 endoplasmic reticulum membrane protein [Colletotrichum orbiculare MAFF 240422]|uniref:UPF0674 endoplasmic reticulum membrane protein n=1 Tax=Colletotrichum orbiculare (strain 104-T / ATCC 96160 / CBS 514.97 / LARS 414 / MAFF 240422) TaxID=1213857 RepID=N4VW16_COLOR|nr:UPF0674 endoplasmic reticulum membrane protein [Colletotrichum orbiculare MAFF 240422]